jgi:hypothetical protein
MAAVMVVFRRAITASHGLLWRFRVRAKGEEKMGSMRDSCGSGWLSGTRGGSGEIVARGGSRERRGRLGTHPIGGLHLSGKKI